MRFLPLLTQQATSRGLITAQKKVQIADVFSLVRDMRYQRASSREPEAIINEWRGTCSGKHYLLKAIFEELGYDARLLMVPHWFTVDNSAHFPSQLLDQLVTAPVPDVHTFLRLRVNNGREPDSEPTWMDVDATWPLGAESLGMPVNRHFVLGVDMDIACEPDKIIEVQRGIAPQAFKEGLIKQHCAGQIDQRNLFIESLGAWLTSAEV